VVPGGPIIGAAVRGLLCIVGAGGAGAGAGVHVADWDTGSEEPVICLSGTFEILLII